MNLARQRITPENDHTDEYLEILNAKKDPVNFKILYERYYQLIFKFVFKKTHDKEITADLTSQVFINALSNIRKYKHQGHPFSSWLYKIAFNEVMMYYRSNMRQRVFIVAGEDLNEMVSGIIESEQSVDDDQRKMMVRALSQLDQDKINLIDLKFFEKKSYAEISTIMEVSESALKVRMFRVIQELQDLIKNYNSYEK